MLSLYVFNVDAGQCIFVYPYDDPNYCALIDCGCDKKVIEFVKKELPNKNGVSFLKNFTLTNYDEDHFRGICEIDNKNIKIETIWFPENLTSDEIENLKEKKTEALNCLLKIKKEYIAPVDWKPPYEQHVYSLKNNDLGIEHQTTNNLSQMVFIEYKGFVICIPGDLEQEGWEKILQKPGVKDKLKETKLFIASHHGRESGYYEKVFDDCHPECIIISDGKIKYETQEYMSSVYAQHVNGEGVSFYGDNRKVLTTRKDEDLLIKIDDNGCASYSKLSINE